MNPPELSPADTIEKRRKQIEKAKAAHLSRQLQTRLQYARLKVDHGWQKQTLNEVENLYFHHYRARISTRGSQKPEKGPASTSQQSPSVHVAAPGSTSTSSVVNTHRTDQQQNMQPTNSPQAPVAVVGAAEDEPSAMEVDPFPDQDVPNSIMAEQTTSNVQVTQPILHDPASHVINPPNSQPPAVPQPPSPTKPPQPSLQSSPIPHTRTPFTHVHISQTHSSAPSVAVTPPPPRNIPLTRKPSLPQPASSSLRPKGPSHGIRPSHSAPSSLFPGSSNAALTYDSFWSSHSTSTNYRSSLTSTASYPSLNKGDASLTLPNLGTAYAFSMNAPSAPFQQPLPLQKQPTLARKPSVPAPLRQSFSGSTGSG